MTEEEKKKLDMTQKAMVFVSVAGGAVGLVLGGILGYKFGFGKGIKTGFDINWESIKDCVESGALHILDEHGNRFYIEDLEKLTVLWD